MILGSNIKPVDSGSVCPRMHILTKKNDSIKSYALCSIELLMSADLKFSTGLSECLLEWDRVQSRRSVPLTSVITVCNIIIV